MLAAVLAAFAATILYVNPLREASLDDDWLYALMVRDLAATGIYHPHQWSAANLPFQTYWGLIFSDAFGYSFTSLRISTLVLALGGIVSFYLLAREHDLDDGQAGLLTLGLLGSPLVLRYSFNFNTDGPFLMCLLLALYLYTRALKTRSRAVMLLASVAGAAAILTRQFGLALPAGLVLLWLIRRRRRDLPLIATGVLLPVLAGAWQLWLGMSTPTMVQQRDLLSTSQYLSNVPILLSNAALVRPAVIIEYVALFTVPFSLLAVVRLCRELMIFRSDSRGPRLAVMAAGSAAFILAGILVGRLSHQNLSLMPLVQWELEDASLLSRLLLTIVATAGAVAGAVALIRRYLPAGDLRPDSEREWLLDLVTLLLLIQQVTYYKFGDRYLLVFVPFALIVIGRYVAPMLAAVPKLAAAACVVMLVLSAGWTRELLAHGEAWWQAAEQVRRNGAAANQIFGSSEWNFYNGSLGDFLSDTRASSFPPTLIDYWSRWGRERKQNAQFIVADGAADGSRYVEVAAVPFRDAFFRLRSVHLLERHGDSTGRGPRGVQ